MLSANCLNCLVGRQFRMLDKYSDEEKKARYMLDVMKILGNMGEGEASPVAVQRMDSLFREYFGEIRSFEAVKKQYNELILEMEDEIYSKAISSDDPILCALKLSRIGNYIDFGALKNVEYSELVKLIDGADDELIDPEEYAAFSGELSCASKLVFLTDNCGEVVFDKVLLRVIREKYPSLDVRIVVRGRAVLNDVTVEDAHLVGLDKVAPVIGNGSGIAGTFIKDVSDETRELLYSADLIIAKGMGNFETMVGCGLNVYYSFLCKCEWFVKRFGMKYLEGIFINERRRNLAGAGSAL